MENEIANAELLTSRREMIGGLGAAGATLMMLGSDEAHAATPLERSAKMYGVFCGTDKKSYICELSGRTMVPAYRMTISGIIPAEFRERHASKFWGSALLVLLGEVTIAVTGGTIRSVKGQPGDKFVFLDTQGDGHSVDIGEGVQMIAIRFKEPWSALSKGLKGWPSHLLPPEEMAPPMNL